MLMGPAFLLRPGKHRLAKQGPLCAIGRARRIHEIRGQIPPFDAIVRMRTVIGRKSKRLAGNDRRKSVPSDAKSGKALRTRGLAAEPESKRAARAGAAGYEGVIARRPKS